MREMFVAPFEVKFAADGQPGEFEGYASVFGVQDSHGDVIMPGAFSDTLAERKAAGRPLIPMHVMHGIYGGDGVPAGVWKTVAEDDKGLHVQGKISGATTTDAGRLLHERVKDGALPGLSIGWGLKKNGTVYGTEPGQPKRTLKSVHLYEISLVDSPSNPQSFISGVKAAFSEADTDTAATSIAAAMRLHDKSMGDSYSYGSPKDKALLMDHLRDAHEALTGSRAPDGLEGWTKAADRVVFEDGLRSTFGMSADQARALADLAFKAAPAPREVSPSAALTDLGKLVTGFRMPTFG